MLLQWHDYDTVLKLAHNVHGHVVVLATASFSVLHMRPNRFGNPRDIIHFWTNSVDEISIIYVNLDLAPQ